jgi:uncharacterized protein (TIGR02453 family)
MKRSDFPGFSPKAISFFRQLERNNKREWFQPRKDQFEELCRKPMLELVTQVVDDLRKFAIDHVVEPNKAIYRIYRDTRFSKDKSPYKTHIAAIFPHARLPKHAGAGYYFDLSHEGLSIGGGVYEPGPVELAALRAAIAKDERAFRKLIEDKRLAKQMGKLQGATLARVPKGFASDHSAEDLLRRKQLYFFTVMKPEAALKSTIRKTIVERFRLMSPLMEWMNDAILRAMESAEADPDRPSRPAPMF